MLLLCFIFALRKIYQVLWIVFLIPSLYILEKNLLVNKYKKQRCYYLYFMKSWKMALFFVQKFVIFNMIPNSFLIEKWETLEHARSYVCNLLNLDCENSTFVLHFSSCLKMKNQKNQMGIVFPSHFHNVMKLENSTHVKRYIFHYFL